MNGLRNGGLPFDRVTVGNWNESLLYIEEGDWSFFTAKGFPRTLFGAVFISGCPNLTVRKADCDCESQRQYKVVVLGSRISFYNTPKILEIKPGFPAIILPSDPLHTLHLPKTGAE